MTEYMNELERSIAQDEALIKRLGEGVPLEQAEKDVEAEFSKPSRTEDAAATVEEDAVASNEGDNKGDSSSPDNVEGEGVDQEEEENSAEPAVEEKAAVHPAYERKKANKKLSEQVSAMAAELQSLREELRVQKAREAAAVEAVKSTEAAAIPSVEDDAVEHFNTRVGRVEEALRAQELETTKKLAMQELDGLAMAYAQKNPDFEQAGRYVYAATRNKFILENPDLSDAVANELARDAIVQFAARAKLSGQDPCEAIHGLARRTGWQYTPEGKAARKEAAPKIDLGKIERAKARSVTSLGTPGTSGLPRGEITPEELLAMPMSEYARYR